MLNRSEVMRLATIALCIAATAATGQESYWADLAARGSASGQDACAYAAADAESVMVQRYAGAAMGQQIAAGMPGAMVAAAYDEPRFLTLEMRRHQVAAFRDAWESRCYAAIGPDPGQMTDGELLGAMRARIDRLAQ